MANLAQKLHAFQGYSWYQLIVKEIWPCIYFPQNMYFLCLKFVHCMKAKPSAFQ